MAGSSLSFQVCQIEIVPRITVGVGTGVSVGSGLGVEVFSGKGVGEAISTGSNCLQAGRPKDATNAIKSNQINFFMAVTIPGLIDIIKLSPGFHKA
jgi:hypothetical protein